MFLMQGPIKPVPYRIPAGDPVPEEVLEFQGVNHRVRLVSEGTTHLVDGARTKTVCGRHWHYAVDMACDEVECRRCWQVRRSESIMMQIRRALWDGHCQDKWLILEWLHEGGFEITISSLEYQMQRMRKRQWLSYEDGGWWYHTLSG